MQNLFDHSCDRFLGVCFETTAINNYDNNVAMINLANEVA
ncbi:hypothetical protein AAKU64_003176 [Undibacterium sp. GrIS 1.8]